MDSKILKQKYWGNVVSLVPLALCSQDMKQTLCICVIFLFRAATEKGLTEHPHPSLSFSPHCSFLFLFYFLSISRFLLTLLWQSAQPQGQRTEGLACVFVMKKEKERAGEERGKGRDGRTGELDMGRIWHIVNAARHKWQFLCKLVEVKYFQVAHNHISVRLCLQNLNFIIILDNHK